MTYSTFCFFHQRFFDSEGRPLAGGSLTFYRAGSTALKPIYLDQSGTTAKNPMSLDSTGLPENQYFGGAGEYDIILKDANGVVINKALRITAAGGSGGGFPDASRGYLYFNGSSYEWRELSKLNVAWAIMDNVTVETLNGLVANWDEVTKEKIYNEHFCIASNENSDGTNNTANSKVLWWLSKDNSGDWVWTVSQFDLTYPLINLNECVRDYLHTHPDADQGADVTNYPAGLWSAALRGDTYYWNPLVVKEFPEPVFDLDGQIPVYTFENGEGRYEWVPSDSIIGKVKVSADDGTAEYLADKIFSDKPEYITIENMDIGDPAHTHKMILRVKGANPLGPAGGDLFGSYPNPRVKELTGVPAMLTDSIATFDWKYSGVWASGAGIGYGTGFVGGVEKPVWMAVSQQGELQISYDEWKTTVYVDPANTYYGTFEFTPQGETAPKTQAFNNLRAVAPFTNWRYASVACMVLPGSTSKWWVFSAESKLAMVEVKPENFNANGSLKVEAIEEWSFTGIDPNTVTSNGETLIWTGNSTKIVYAKAADIYYDTKYISGHEVTPTPPSGYTVGVIGGNAWNGTEFLCVGRDSGILYSSTNGIDWTVKNVASVKYQDGTAMTHHSALEYAGALPTNTNPGSSPSWSANGNAWGGMAYLMNMWIVVNGKPAPSSLNTYWSPFLFSYDGVNWNAYAPTPDELGTNYSYQMYKIAFGHGKTFATNSDPMQAYKNQPSIYRLLVDEIPAHRKLVAEKGIDVLGVARLLDLPNATSLATNEEGEIIDGGGAVAQIGDAPEVDYVFSPFNGGTRKWVPNGKASGIVKNVLGPIVRDNVNHTITVPAYTVQLFDNNDFLGQPLRYEVAQATFTISNINVRSFVTAKYIAPGVAMTVLTPFVDDLNLSSQAPLFSVERTQYTDGTDQIHAIEFDTQGEGLAQKTTVMLTRTEPYRRSKEGGLMISSAGLYVGLTPSKVFAATTPIDVLAYDSHTDNLTHAYKVAGAWKYTVEPTGQFDNQNYSNGTDLVEMGANKYKNVWIYRSIGDDKESFYVDGLEYNTSDAAQEEAIPTIPSLLDWHCMLVGRITIQKNATSGYIVKSAFTNPFAGASANSGYVRNQGADGTNDLPGNVFLGPDGSVQISESAESTYPNTLMNGDGFVVQNDVVDTTVNLSGLHVHDRIDEGGNHAVYADYGANSLLFRSWLGDLTSTTEDWYKLYGGDYNGVNNNYRGYQFDARLKLRVGQSDATPAELQHKFVDSDGNEFPLVDHGAYGKAIQIAGGGGSASGAGYLPTMDYAAATAVGYPPINGDRTEICVLLVAPNDIKLDLLTSVMGASCIQGATGAFIMTIRDVDGNLIANSVTINNPAANTFLTSPIGNIQDPITQANLTTYTLKGGVRYYFGIHYGMNGSAFLGTVGGSTTNIRPLPAIRFENLAQLTQHLDMAGTDGTESLFRPYVRVTVTGA